jgi:hypothetical protein
MRNSRIDSSIAQAASEPEDAVGGVEDDAGVLLDDEHRDALGVELAERRVDLLDEARGEGRRGLVEEQQFRLDDERAGDRQDALLAAAEAAGELAAPGAEQREPLVDLLDRRADRARVAEAVAAEHEVLVDRHLGEEAAGLGDEADPAPHDLVGPAAVEGLAAQPDAARERADVAEDRLQQRRLSRSVRPDDADDPPGRHGERDALQDLQPAVAGADVVDLEDHARAAPLPSSASTTRSSRRIASGAPSAIFSPWSMTTILSQSRITKFM